MEELDCDNGLLTDDNGRSASRDIVQFVKFEECIQKGNLAEEVLREVPEKVNLFNDVSMSISLCTVQGGCVL